MYHNKLLLFLRQKEMVGERKDKEKHSLTTNLHLPLINFDMNLNT